MLEHSIYSVISPEGCASILWRTAERARDAADALKLTANDLVKLEVVDDVVAEPVGGAHRAPKQAMASVKAAILRALAEFDGQTPEAIRQARREKYLNVGKVGLA